MGFKLGKSLGSLGNVVTGGLLGGVAGATLGGLYDAMKPGKINAPQLPGAPTLNEYGAYPEFTDQEKAYMQQQEALLKQYQGLLGQQPSAYQQSSDEIGAAENRNYLQALNQQAGALSVAQQQQQRLDFQKLVESAGARGIRIRGDDPMSATSDSTAGNQILSNFNQRYQTLADQNRLAQIQLGGGQNLARLGFNQNAQSAQLGNILNLQTAYGNQMQPYAQQRLGAYGTQNANVDIRNQGLLNQYQSAQNQAMLNYQASAQNQANKMGFINSLIGLGGTVAGAAIGGPGGAAIGGKVMQMPQQSNMGFAPNLSMNRLSLY
jgi:citrate lyase gamma subunit